MLELSNNKISKKNIELSLSNLKDNGGKILVTPLDNIEKNLTAPPLQQNKLFQSKKTFGREWNEFKTTKLTPEIKTDLKLLTLRNYIDPKHHYKSKKRTELPKEFQFGEIVETAKDFYSGRLNRKERKRTMAEELLADSELLQYAKKKSTEILDSKNSRRKFKKRKKNS